MSSIRNLSKIRVVLTVFVALNLFFPRPAQAMHIMEGFLPFKWSVLWTLASLPFVALGVVSISRKLAKNPELKLLLGAAGAFTFVMSALKIPSVTGSSSHPTGSGLGTMLFGPLAMSVLGVIVLLFQAVLLAHGGLTTLGANTFSMAIAGPFAAYGVYRLLSRIKVSQGIAVFLTAFIADLTTYVVTSLQLALAFPSGQGGILASAIKFLSVFALTQIPIAISEGLVTVVVMNFLVTYSKQEISLLNLD